MTWTKIISWVVFVVVLGANIFTLIQPILETGQIQNTVWMLVGPILFGVIGIIWYRVRERRAD